MKARNEIDPKYQWDFTPIYPSDEAWEQELNELMQEVEKLAALEGTLGNSREALKAGLDTLAAVGGREGNEPVCPLQHGNCVYRAGDPGDPGRDPEGIPCAGGDEDIPAYDR